MDQPTKNIIEVQAKELLEKAHASYKLGDYDQATAHINTLFEKFGQYEHWLYVVSTSDTFKGLN